MCIPLVAPTAVHAFGQVEFRSVEVDLASGHPRFLELVAGESYRVAATATVHCLLRDVSTSLALHLISEEELGHPFADNSNLDYDALKRQGEVVVRSGRKNLECGEGYTFPFAATAPVEPGVYYVGACLPTIRDEEGDPWPQAGPEGNLFNCSAPVQLRVEPRPAADLVVSRTVIEPTAAEYRPGQPVTLEVSVRNVGDGISGSTWLNAFHSSRRDLRAGAQLAQRRIDPIPPGGRVVERFRLETVPVFRATFYGACVSPSPPGEDASLPGGWTGTERDGSNNCSPQPVEVQTTRSGLPEVEVIETSLRDGDVAPGAPIELELTVENRARDDFKGRWVLLRKRIVRHLVPRLQLLEPEIRPFDPNAPRGLEQLRELVLDAAVFGEQVASQGVLVPAGEAETARPVSAAPEQQGMYELRACASDGRRVFGCGEPVRLVVRDQLEP